jgi:hypothetical protein
VLQSHRYSSGSSCWGGRAIYPIPSHPWQPCSAENADIQIFWVSDSHANPLTHNSVPIQASLAGLARCSIAHADGSRSSASRGSEPLGIVSRKKSGLNLTPRSSSLSAAMQAYVRLDLPPHVILVL